MAPLDATGRLVRSLSAEAGLTHALDLSDLASGIYLVRLPGTQASGAPVSLSQRLRKE